MKTQKNQLKAVDVGTYISQAFKQTLRESFDHHFPGSANSVNIPKSLLLKVLKSSPPLTGIRFMYGLTDNLNPNSLKVFLVPCTHTSEYDPNSKPLLAEKGYYDHMGQLHTLMRTAELISNFVRSLNMRDSSLVYKETTRGSFFGKNSLLDLIKNEGCHSIQLHLGLEDKIIHPVIEPLNSLGQAFLGVYMEYASPCPPFCFDPPSDPDCFSSQAVSRYSDEKELDVYRAFRDQVLLDMESGPMLYEMYYFISPLISSWMAESDRKEELLRDLYFQKIVPFKQLLATKKFEEATILLKKTLEELAGSYELDLVGYGMSS